MTWRALCGAWPVTKVVVKPCSLSQAPPLTWRVLYDVAVARGAAGLHLLGMICKETGRRAAAITHFSAALTLDPFLWTAYEELCALGAEEEAASVVELARPVGPGIYCSPRHRMPFVSRKECSICG